MAKRREPKPELWNVGNVREMVDRAATHAGRIAAQDVIDETHNRVLEHPMGSPIEVIFFAWWAAIQSNQSPDCRVELASQVEVTTPDGQLYVLDFSVNPWDADAMFDAHQLGVEYPQIAIELDGHQFHEKTKQQATYRNRRDRDLQGMGWRVYHVSGSELYRRPVEVVTEIQDSAVAALFEMRRGVRRVKAGQRG